MRIVIFINFGAISWNLENIFQSRGLYTNSWWPWFAVKWRQQNFVNAHLQVSAPKYSPLYFNTEKVAEPALRASWFWQTSGGFPGTWGIFFSPLDAKLGADERSVSRLWAQNIAILHFKTKTVAETTFRASWFWSTSARSPGTCEIFSSPGTLN